MESVSKPYELIVLRPNVYSLHFEEKHPYALHQLLQLFKQNIPELIEVTHTFNRINLFSPDSLSTAALLEQLNDIDFSSCLNFKLSKIWELPICFDASFTTDLQDIFDANQVNIDAFLKTFLATTFTLEFYGFLPGFGYLSGLPKSLHLDLKKIPDKALIPGSVAIGGEQVGVYPQKSPGGWQCICNSPAPWINFDQEPPVFIKAGDGVRFVEIDLKRHKEIAVAVEMNVYQSTSLTL